MLQLCIMWFTSIFLVVEEPLYVVESGLLTSQSYFGCAEIVAVAPVYRDIISDGKILL